MGICEEEKCERMSSRECGSVLFIRERERDDDDEQNEVLAG